MSQKQGSSKKPRKHKTSAGVNGGGGKVKLSPLQKILIANGGAAHNCRGKRMGQLSVPKQRKTRADKQAAL